MTRYGTWEGTGHWRCRCPGHISLCQIELRQCTFCETWRPDVDLIPTGLINKLQSEINQLKAVIAEDDAKDEARDRELENMRAKARYYEHLASRHAGERDEALEKLEALEDKGFCVSTALPEDF